MVLMRKPNKPGRGPGDFRPLCLQDPCGKAIIKLVADKIRPAIHLHASRFPQHAYLPGRSTEGALLNVFNRCRHIRQITQNAGHNVFARRSGNTSEPYTGGIVLSLDMTTAFDSVPRVLTRDSLLRAGVADADISIIMAWLTGATYHLQHAHVNLRIITAKGVRQGCTLSPLVWACYTCYVAEHLESLISLDDLQIYADDFIWSKIFHTRQQFLDALSKVPLFLAKLKQLGLKVNISKTAALIRMARNEGRRLLKQHLCKTAQGTYLCFLAVKPIRIPVKTSHVYLGCVISLRDFESMTVRHRMEAAKTQFSRLRSVLTSSRCLSLKRRARIWQACVWSTLMYGWTCCGCSGFLLTQVCSLVHTQLRAIARSPRHITHTTNEEVCAMLGLPGPKALLLQAVDGLGRRLEFVRATSDDLMRRPDLHTQAEWARDQLISAAACLGRLERVAATQGVACTVCGIYFDNESSMRKHRSRKHPEAVGVPVVDTSQIRREAFCVDGMPVCRGCGKTFHHMHTLLRHIRHNRCQGRSAGCVTGEEPAQSSESPAEPKPIAQRVNLLQTWVSEGTRGILSSLASQPDLKKELTQHCCLCRQWFSDWRHIKLHHKISHKAEYQTHHEHATADCSGLTGAVTDPCEFCGHTVTKKKRHATSCPVLYQVAFSCRHYGGTLSGSARLTLRGCASGGQQDAGGSRHDAPPGNATSIQRQVQEGRDPGKATQVPASATQGQRKRQGESAGQEAQRGLSAFFSRGHAAGGAADPHDGPALSKVRGCHQRAEAGPGIHDAVQNKGRREHPEDPARLIGQVGSPSDCQADRVCQADCTVQGDDSGTSGQGQILHGAGDEASIPDSAGVGHKARSARTNVAATSLECGAAEGYPVPRHGPSSTREGDAGHGGVDRAYQWPGNPTIPRNAAAGSGVCGGHVGVQAGGEHERPGTHAGARGTCIPDKLVVVAPHRGSDAPRIPQALGAGQARAAAARERVLALVLHNTGNSCYQNAFVLSWLWTLVHANALQDGGYCDEGLGRGRGVVDALLSGTVDRLTRVFAWSSVLLDWSRPQMQHDVGAFASHALAKLRSPFMCGEWQSRREDPALRVLDTGPLHIPITMVIPDGSHTLQDCIEAWKLQHSIHALCSAPDMLVLQLGRFRQNAQRRFRKYRCVVMLPTHVQMPCFVDASERDTYSVSYKVMAGVYHLGTTMSSGHYRAFLSEALSEGGSVNPGEPRCVLEKAVITDDGHAPTRIAEADFNTVLTNAYLIWLVKD